MSISVCNMRQLDVKDGDRVRLIAQRVRVFPAAADSPLLAVQENKK